MLDLALATLTSPPVLFFALGLGAALVRSDLALSEAVSKGISLYLVLAIGFKGGVEMASGASWAAAGVVLAGIALSATLPLISFTALRTTTRLGQVDAASIAAAHGHGPLSPGSRAGYLCQSGAHPVVFCAHDLRARYPRAC